MQRLVVSMAVVGPAADAAAPPCPEPAVAGQLLSGPAAVAQQVARELALSRRETQVLVAASRGQCIKETAADLGVSVKAVQYFWARIFMKSGCASQLQVLALLLRHATSSDERWRSCRP
jgi:DNA-binding NarL/FixJ family response regulator